MSLKKAPSLPKLPGVYLFKNANHEVIYIGKAKCLNDRVGSYFARQEGDWKVKELIAAYDSIEHIVTTSESEALVLEAQLIQEYQPKFNTLLKGGNPFLYLMITPDTPGQLPAFKIVRSKKSKGYYFGPFMDKKSAKNVYAYIIRTFALKLCNKQIENGCLDYHLGLCAGMCRSDFNKEEYLLRMDLAKQALKSNHEEYLKILNTALKKAIADHAFEKAKYLHEYVQNLDTIFAAIRTRYKDDKYLIEVMQATAPKKYVTRDAESGLNELQALLALPTKPSTIDCFDISHFQSQGLVGSCIRFLNGAPDKNKFRRFKIKTLVQQNDYAALAEIVARRYKHGDYPDIILIDGGKGQRSSITALNLSVPVISLAKREERLFSDNHPEGTILSPKEPIGQLLIALRDYAHHFAITYHRLVRSKERT